MALNAKNIPSNGGDYERPDPLEPGTYPCRLVQIVTLGLQPQRPYQGDEKPPAQELYLTYEFLDEFLVDDDGEEIKDKPRWLSETIPFHSLDSDLAKSTKRYFALDPDVEHGGDWAELGGAPCMVTIVAKAGKGKNSDTIYNNINGVSTMRAKEAKNAPELVNPPKIFDIDEPDMEIFGSLPKWLQDKMKENLDYDGSALQDAVENQGESSKGEDKATSTKKKKAADKPSEETDEEEDW